jgi:hypothetical protein
MNLPVIVKPERLITIKNESVLLWSKERLNYGGYLHKWSSIGGNR